MKEIEQISLKFDGVYSNKPSGRGGAIYLRFYEDGGAVCTILGNRLSPAEIFPSLTESNPATYKGNYNVVKDDICVTVSQGDVSIEFSGKCPKGLALYVNIVFFRAGTIEQKSTGIWLDYAQPIYLDHNLSREILKTFLDPGLITFEDIEEFADQLRDFGNRVGERTLEYWINAIKTDHLDGLIGLVNMGRNDALLSMLERLGGSAIYVLSYERQGEKIPLDYDGPILYVFTKPTHAIEWMVKNKTGASAGISYLEHPMDKLFTSNAIGPSPWHVHINPGIAPFELRLDPLLVDTVYNFAFHGIAGLGGQRLS